MSKSEEGDGTGKMALPLVTPKSVLMRERARSAAIDIEGISEKSAAAHTEIGVMRKSAKNAAAHTKSVL